MDLTFEIKTNLDSIADVRNRILAFISSRNEPTIKKVEKAISIIENAGKIASVTAIVNWILGNYSIMDPQKLKINVKKSILKGLKEGMFMRSVGSKKALGVTGSFSLASMKKQKKTPINEKKSASLSKTLPLVQKPRINGIKRRKSASNEANVMRSEKRFSKSRSKRIPTVPDTTTDPDFKFLTIATSFESLE